MKPETLQLALLLHTRIRRIVTALVLGLVTAGMCLTDDKLTTADAVGFGVFFFVAVWAVAEYLNVAARRYQAGR